MYHLQNIANRLVNDVKERRFVLGREPKMAYALVFKTVLQALGRSYFPEVENNPLLTAIINDVRLLVTKANSLLRRKIAESMVYLKTAMDILERTKTSMEPLYILLCDALSITECMFLTHTFPKFIGIDGMIFALNPSGKTATFKYLAEGYLDIKVKASEEVTMKNICETLRRKLRARGSSVFRNIDMLIHYGGEYEDINKMVESLFGVASKLCREVEKLMNNGYKVLIMADHGYDVHRKGSLWILTHSWERERLCMSPLVPIIVLR